MVGSSLREISDLTCSAAYCNTLVLQLVTCKILYRAMICTGAVGFFLPVSVVNKLSNVQTMLLIGVCVPGIEKSERKFSRLKVLYQKADGLHVVANHWILPQLD